MHEFVKRSRYYLILNKSVRNIYEGGMSEIKEIDFPSSVKVILLIQGAKQSGDTRNVNPKF